MKTAKYYSKNYDEIGMVSYVLLVYSNEDSEGYTVQKQKDASLKKIEIYQDRFMPDLTRTSILMKTMQKNISNR